MTNVDKGFRRCHRKIAPSVFLHPLLHRGKGVSKACIWLDTELPIISLPWNNAACLPSPFSLCLPSNSLRRKIEKKLWVALALSYLAFYLTLLSVVAYHYLACRAYKSTWKLIDVTEQDQPLPVFPCRSTWLWPLAAVGRHRTGVYWEMRVMWKTGDSYWFIFYLCLPMHKGVYCHTKHSHQAARAERWVNI